MIVDLLRNDLGRVCEVDSVRVPELMVVEDYATVHQLISTITGVLERDHTPRCSACGPASRRLDDRRTEATMSSRRTERVARGVYSGAIGYFGVDGNVDLSIVIRTIVLRPGATTIAQAARSSSSLTPRTSSMRSCSRRVRRWPRSPSRGHRQLAGGRGA